MVRARTTTTTTVRPAPRRRQPPRRRVVIKRKRVVRNVFNSNSRRQIAQPVMQYRNFNRLKGQNKRMTAAQRRKTIMPYIHCRLNPWSGMGNGTGLPDGSDIRRVVIDHRFISTFSFGTSGIFNINLIPCFPTCLIAQVPAGDTGFKINGQTPASHIGSPNLWYKAGILPEWANIPLVLNNAQGQFDSFVPYLEASRARVVTMGLRVIYTGSTNFNSGWVVINRSTMSIGDAAPNSVNFTISGSNGVDQTYGIDQVLIRPTNMSVDNTLVGVGAWNDRLEHGAYSLSHHGNNVYEWARVADNVAYATTDNFTQVGLILRDNTYLPAPTFASHSPIAFADTDWSVQQLNVTGGTAGQTFNVEVVVCVEYAPNTSSAVYQMAKNTPEAKREIIAANNAARNLPTATKDTITLDSVAAAASTAASLLPVIATLF